jgi:hypothetical protein
MRKRIIQKLTMLALIVMASIPAFAQGGKFGTNAGATTSVPPGKNVGDPFDYYELKYEVTDAPGGMYTVKVIGFSEYAKNAPEKFVADGEFDQTVTIPHYVKKEDSTPFVVDAVAEGAFGTSAEGISDIASKVKKLVIDFKSDAESEGATQDIPVSIGANAFAGLTALTEVKNLTPGAIVAAISESAFADAICLNASLIVPDCSMGKYAKAQGWKKFVSIYNTGGELFGDINGNGSVAGNDVTALKKVIAGTRTETDACDVNSSGGVTGADVTALKKVIAGTY